MHAGTYTYAGTQTHALMHTIYNIYIHIYNTLYIYIKLQVFSSRFIYIRADQGRLRPARAYGFVFERHQRSDFFVEKLYGMRARALASACACPRGARGRPRRLLLSWPLGGSAGKWTNVVWPIKRRQTNQQTNKHTLLFYRYRLSWSEPS